MKKLRFFMMLFVVGLSAAACDKTEEVYNEGALDEPQEIMSIEDKEAQKFIGLWTTTLYTRDIDTNTITGEERFEWRFYEDKTGHKNIESYNTNGVLHAFSRGPFSYYIKEGLLHIAWHDSVDIEWHYTFEGDKMLIHSDMDETGRVLEFVKTEDADDKFVGDWMTVMQNHEGNYVAMHYKFQTPTYGHAYESVYKNLASPPIDTHHLYELRYEFTNDKIVITNLNGSTETKYYRLAGDKLYLSNKRSGEAIEFSRTK